ncbi:unnamed protein product [marine sediment metagenome]|uniref:Uncharacterized protein n=1 Tax=marine sediment metagenome TaxID=412755 RepID=X0VSZ4_9ZZZZ
MADFKYEFPLDGRSGKMWHMTYKVHRVVGLKPGAARNSTRILLMFNQALDSTQEADLNTFMARADIFDAIHTGFIEGTGTNVFVVKDLFYSRAAIDAWIASMGISGLDGMMFAVESDPIGNPGIYDEIHIHFNKLLTQQDKKKVANAYSGAGDWQA